MSTSTITQLLHEVRSCTARMDSMEKNFTRHSRERGDAIDTIRKALSDGRGPVATVGFDGGDTLGLLRLVGGKQNKSLGWGRFLSTVAESGRGGDPVRVEKALEKMGSKPVEKASLAEGSGVTGGYTVPVQFYAELMRLVAEQSFVRQMCTTIPMTSRNLLVPALNHGTPASGTSTFFGGIAASWQSEGATISQSEPTFTQIELVARDLVFHTVASNQLLQDNAVALDTFLSTLFIEAMAWFFDYYILRGDGASQPLGIINAPAQYLYNRGTNTTFKFADAAGMVSRLLMSSWANACWIMHPSVIPELVQMTDSANGRLVWLNQFPGTAGELGGGAASKLPMQLFGIPIYFTEKVPILGTKGDVSLVDLSKYLVGDRLAIQIETSTHVKFLQNQMVWRIVARWDGQPWLKTPVVLADGTYEMSPFVVLDT